MYTFALINLVLIKNFLRDENGAKVVAPGDTNYVTGHVVIPSVITVTDGEFSITFAVTAIGDNAFSTCSGLTSIEIPSSVTTINENAFLYCISLTNIDLPYSLITTSTTPSFSVPPTLSFSMTQ